MKVENNNYVITLLILTIPVSIYMTQELPSGNRIAFTALIGMISFITATVTFNFLESAISIREQKRRVKELLADPMDKLSKKERKSALKKLKEQDGEKAVQYAELTVPKWIGLFIPGGLRNIDRVRMDLAAAGYNKPKAVIGFVALRLFLPVILAWGTWKFGDKLTGLDPAAENYLMIKWGISITVIIFGYFWFPKYIKGKGTERANKISMALPDAVDILSIYVSAGVSFDAALVAANNYIKEISVPTAKELHVLSNDLSVTHDRGKSFDDFLYRCNTRSVREFVSIIKQADRDGTPMSQALQKMTTSLRKERLLMIEKKAAKIPTLLLLPQIGLLLPCFATLLLYTSFAELLARLGGMNI